MSRKLKLLTAHNLYLLCVIALMKVVDRSASPRLGRFFARAAAFSAWQLSKRRRRSRLLVLARTLGTCEAETRQIAKKCFYEFWHSVFSFPYDGIQRPDGRAAELRGLEHLQKALANGKGVILWESQSFGKRVLAKHILHQNGFSVCQLHGEEHLEGFRNSKSWTGSNVIRPFFENRERPFVKEIIYLKPSKLANNRTVLQRLRHNAIVCVSADGKQGYKSIRVQFLGSYNFFPTGLVTLARLSGATILPLFCIQRNGLKATLIIEQPISIETNEDRERCVETSIQQYVGLLEYYIRTYPDQYLTSRLSVDDELRDSQELETELR